MISTITQSAFTAWFANSETRKNQFSYGALIALFEYLEELEESIGEPIEFDPIALCCDYAEFESALECAKEYDYEEVVDLKEKSLDLLEVAELEEKQALDWLQDRTTVILFDGGVLIQQF